MTNQIIFDGRSYSIIDALEKITIADSYVYPSNKIGVGSGHREMYLSSKSNNHIREFIGSKNFEIDGYFLKKDLLAYLHEVKNEYFYPQQNYQKKEEMSQLRKERIDIVQGYPEIINIKLIENTGRNQSDDRLYIIPKDEFISSYDLIRKICLPNITFISIVKLLSEQNEVFYYFKLFVDYFGETTHPKEIMIEEAKIAQENISLEEKKQLITARQGQGKYRDGLLKLCPFCPITMISDDRLLIASHIKPRAHSKDIEKVDPLNGFMLTPTFDYMFDRGYITFSNQKEIIISPWISKLTCSKLDISPNKKFHHLPIEGREQYLDYHRANIFKG